MARLNALIGQFNRGRISPLALARVGQADKAAERVRLSAETQTNWIPRVLGSMMLRPGLKYLSTSKSSLTATHIPFIYAFDDMAYLQLTNLNMRVYIDDVAITRASVSTTIANGTFDSNLTSWTDADEVGATSSWLTGGYMALKGTGSAKAIRQQTLTIGVGDQNVAHALRITVTRGPITVKIGSSSGGDQYGTASLGTGVHSLAFTPTGGSAYLQFESAKTYTVLLDSVAIESSGVVDIPTPWTEADLDLIRFDQSADIIYVTAYGYQQRKIQRFGTTSWSIVKYEPEDGPFLTQNTTATTISPSTVSGDITLTASDPIFTSANVGSLYKIESIGQFVTVALSAGDQWSDPIRVTGVDNGRIFSVSRTAFSTGWASTPVTLQRSISEPGDWTDVTTYTSSGVVNYDDSLDNQIIYYRIGVDTSDFSTGTAAASLTYAAGSNTGIARITAFSTNTSVSAIVLDNLGSTTSSPNWSEGLWSDRRGYPSAGALYEGRFSSGGKGRVVLSESDAFEGYDESNTDDNGPINKTIGSGPSDQINWVFPGRRLVFGTDTREVSIRSNSLEEVVTPTNFAIRYPTTYGSANIPAAVLDSQCIFVHRNGIDVIELTYNESSYEYDAKSLTTLIPTIGDPGIVKIAIQRQPETRIHCVRSDGTVAILVYDPAEDVAAWIDFETTGDVEDVFVMPGEEEDAVYYFVKRTINAGTVRYLEKWALESECQGGTLNKQADSFKSITQSSSTTITGLSHLEAASVVVWANGKDLGTYTVASGSITVSEAVTTAIVGLTYNATYLSTKLAYGADGRRGGTALNQPKRIDRIAVTLYNTHYQGLQYGPDLNTLDNLPLTSEYTDIADDTVHSTFDQDSFEFNGAYTTDSRLALKATAPKPCTVLSCVLSIETHEKL